MDRRAAITALGAAALPLAGCAERFFFHPEAAYRRTPTDLGLAYQDQQFASTDGVNIAAWWVLAAGGASNARATVVHAHGNAQNISHHLPFVAWLPALGLNVLTFDYRGFGKSTGQPTLDGIVDDATHAMRFTQQLLASAPASARRLILLGQSLGGATMLRASAAADAALGVRLTLIDSAFDSYRGIARQATQGSPLAWGMPLLERSLPPPERDPIAAAARLNAPLLLVHGTADAVIPFAASERLLAAASPPKRLLRVDGGQHIDGLLRASVQSDVIAAIDAALAA
jgi:uncharacterized protein